MTLSKEIHSNQKYRFELETLLDTSRLLIESHDVDFILNNLLLISMGKLLINRAAVLWYNPRDRNHIVKTKKGRHTLPDSVSVPKEPFREKNSLFCRDHSSLSFLADHGIELLVTIKNNERHLGFLALGSKIGNQPVSSQEVRILESLVFMSGVAIANSELVEELRSTNRKLDYKVQELFTLFDLSKAFNASVDREEIKRIFKFTLLGQLFIRRFFLIIRRNDHPITVTRNGLDKPLTEPQMEELLSMDESIVRVDDELLRQYPYLGEHQIHLILKLHNEGGEPAIIGLGRRANGLDFEQTDFNFLISVGNLALMSIQKTYLLEDQIEKERMEEELHIARSIQQKLLPDKTPEIPNLQIAAINIPSYQIGGDYYDLIRDDHGNLTMAIADVTGKGVPASLLMANLQSVLHILQPFDIGMVEATGQINALIYQNTPIDKFISFFWGRFDHEKRTLRYVNAGHNPPVLLRKDHDPILLSEGGVLLGAMPTMTPYEEAEIPLETGDLLSLYTDGITEAMNDGNEEFGESRLMECLKNNLDKDPHAILEAVISEVRSFSGEPFADDFTLIVCKVT